MINIKKALQLIVKSSNTIGTESIEVVNSNGCVLAEDLKSKYNIPLFDNSAMDGFAIKYSYSLNATKISPLSIPIAGTVRAGDPANLKIKKGQAIKIMTGAPVPKGADTVIRKEDCIEENGYIILKQAFGQGQNIRYKGEVITKGSNALVKGTYINPAAIGFILELGYQKIKVFRKPKISLIVTGSELAGPGERLTTGKIRDTNTYSLSAAVEEETGIKPLTIRLSDNYDSIKKSISEQIKQSDVLLIAGGISVGEYDFIKDILNSIGVKEVFWGVKQRPGGPLFFGLYKNKPVFGLPGNPASSLVCFYEYVRPSILKLCGRTEYSLPELEAVYKGELVKKPGKTHFIRGVLKYSRGQYVVSAGENQGSHAMNSFALSNCFIIFPEKQSRIEDGQKVLVHLFR